MTHSDSPFVATILANPDIQALDENEIHSIVDAMQASGAIIDDVNWLAENTACDIYFAVLSLDEAQRMFTHLLAGVPFDFCVQPNMNRKKKLLICDMDSTIIQQECIDELADFAGIKDKVSEITRRAMNGELDFKNALRERVSLLKGLPLEALEKTYNERITFTPGAKKLVQTMRENGVRCLLVSGGFTFFTSHVKNEIGFHFEEANILEQKDGKLTGKVQEPILDKEAKLKALQFHIDELGISAQDCIAVGDGANDLPMLKAAGLGVAYHAHQHVKEQTSVQIDTCDLSALLYAQGYKFDEIRGVS